MEHADHLARERLGCLQRRAQHPVGRIRPADRERLGEHRRLVVGGQQGRHILRMGARLRGGQEPRPDPHTGRAGAEHGRHRPGAGDPAGGQDRHSDGLQHFGEQWQQCHRAAHVPARLHSLGGDQVAAGVGGALGLGDRADLPAGQRPTGMDELDQGGVGIGPEEFHQPRPTGCQLDLGPVARAAGCAG